MDTVFPVGTVEKHPYTREGDILRGPGVLDMKSGVLMILEIFRHFSDKMPPDFSLVALLNCDEEIGSLAEKYGADHVSQIITFGTLAARAAIRDCGRALGMSYSDVDIVARAVPQELNITISYLGP